MSEPSQKLRVLFVCRQNKVRSLTAEHLYRVRQDLEVRSAGTATFAKNQLTTELVTWADVIFVFDETQIEAIATRFQNETREKQVICLDLPDIFEYKSQSLVLKLTAKLEPYLGRPNSKKIPAGKIPSPTSPKRSKSSGEPARSLVSQLLAAVGVKGGTRKLSD
ncbi:MAG: hypothetical protein V9H26_26380 [Verrucomicrobiota bacterium]|nr:hypothetical protein [Verrucomicrobiota bacterium]MCC6820268.1 hypothetical protein [Limisphaerales bacterium]